MSLPVGIVGVGGIGQAHAANLSRMPEVGIAAVCDSDAGRAEHAAALYRARAYIDWREMFARETLQAVYVCVPPAAHPAIELAAIRAGLPVYLEKPVACDLSVTGEVIAEIRRHNALVSVGYVVRYCDLVARMRELLAGKTVSVVVGQYYSGIPESAWWTDRRISGGQLVEQSTHVVDTLRSLVGEITNVALFETRQCAAGTVPIGSVVSFTFASGTVGSVTSCCTAPEWMPVLDVVTADGMRLTLTRFAVLQVNVRGTVQEHHTAVDMLWEADRAFIAAVKTGDPSHIRCTYEDAVRTLAVTLGRIA